DRSIDLSLLCNLHEAIFRDVRSYAGRIRQRGFGTEHLSFGPNRSASNSEVPNAMLDLFDRLRPRLLALEAEPEADNFEERAFRLAVQAHADIVRIHPYQDGNGRCSRLFMNWILVRLGLRPIGFEVVREEYLSCLNHYFRTDQPRLLEDLA